ncbi:solute carrier family 12 member 8 [Phodopus roborovskii]|uniref:solute carrier family 12 member 8 n=1 Tax=Phodopus roborovskii TaxID=109678 RepID=UPI0021E45F0D|nr:solute carrier family 12 member 8 [Phodopus roborovskii]
MCRRRLEQYFRLWLYCTSSFFEDSSMLSPDGLPLPCLGPSRPSLQGCFEHGFIGYSPELLESNILPEYSPGESFFTVFGVFFPAATGVMAGFNMGGDLREPATSIPLGSLAAVGISWFLYIVFAFLLGAICTREALHSDFLIAEKVSLVGFLFLLGLYISSLASCMGGLYGAPRILQCIAQEKVVPVLAFLGQGKGPNKTPVAAICLTSLVTMAFVLVGQVNVLAPVVTINFMLTYIAVDYSFFALSMTPCSLPQSPEAVPREGPDALPCSEHLLQDRAPSYGSGTPAGSLSEGTLLEFTKDMDQLLQPTERHDSCQLGSRQGNWVPKRQKGKSKKAAKRTLRDSFLLDLGSLSFPAGASGGLPAASWEEQESHHNQQASRSESHDQLVPDPCNQPRGNGEDFFMKCRLQEQEVQRRPSASYTCMCNPWVSLFGAIASLLIMFVIQWVYTLLSMGVAVIVYFYIGQSSPSLYLGSASNFSFFRWMKSLLTPPAGRSLRSNREQIVLAPSPAKVDMAMTQLTQENTDFATRDRYHHSSLDLLFTDLLCGQGAAKVAPPPTRFHSSKIQSDAPGRGPITKVVQGLHELTRGFRALTRGTQAAPALFLPSPRPRAPARAGDVNRGGAARPATRPS